MLLWLWLRPAATAPIQPLVEDPIAPSLWQVYPLKKKKCFGASLWCRGLRIQHCHCSSSGSCFGAVLTPGQVTSVCCRHSKKKKKKKRYFPFGVYFPQSSGIMAPTSLANHRSLHKNLANFLALLLLLSPLIIRQD